MDANARAAFRRSSVDRALKSFRCYSDLDIINETLEKPSSLELESGKLFGNGLDISLLENQAKGNAFDWFDDNIKKYTKAKKTDASDDKENVEPAINPISEISKLIENSGLVHSKIKQRKKTSNKPIERQNRNQLRRSKRLTTAVANQAEKENQIP